MFSTPTLFYALLGGLLPALLWLWFWLKEDARCPEPRSLITLTFVAGMGVVLVVLPAERLAAGVLGGTTLVIVWAIIEEVFKFLAAGVVILWRRAVNEPIDVVIYMITVALGFAAFENALFLLSPLSEQNLLQSVVTGNLRFLGATLLHTLASAIIGIASALSFYRARLTRMVYLAGGLILAIVLHALFNFSIMFDDGEKLLYVFFVVWLGVIGLLLSFERVKRLSPPNTC